MRRSREQRQHLRTLSALEWMNRALARQLQRNALPTEQLLCTIQKQSPPMLQSFFSHLNLQHLEEQPFSQQWRHATLHSHLCATAQELEQLQAVGSVLGSCSVEEQCNALHQAADYFAAQRQSLLASLAGEERLSYTLWLSAGLLGAVMLL